MWLTLTFGLFLEEAYLGRIVAPGPHDQIMEIVTSAKLFKNVWLVFDLPRNRQ
jgi:hypothetical protein